MRMRATVMVLLALAGCATRPATDASLAHFDVNQRRQLLQPEASAGAPGEVQPYQLAASERFRMPVALHAPDPALPEDHARQSLAPTTVCLRVIIDAQGQVQRSEPLLAHSRCAGGAEAGNASLLQSALSATADWVFQPAALCHFVAGSAPAGDGCEGAARLENVPVTLSYAFTFEVVEGRASVRQGGLR